MNHKKLTVVEIQMNDLYNVEPIEHQVATFWNEDEAKEFVVNRSAEYVNKMVKPAINQWTVDGMGTEKFHAHNNDTGHDFTLEIK